MKPNSQVTLGEFFRQCVGIDISKNKFTTCLYMYDRASDVGCCTKSIDFDNTKSGFNQMVKWSRKGGREGLSADLPHGAYGCILRASWPTICTKLGRRSMWSCPTRLANSASQRESRRKLTRWMPVAWH